MFFKKQKTFHLGIESLFEYLFSFVCLFFIFLRLLSFFRTSKSLDLKYYFFEYNLKYLLLIYVFFFFLRKLIFLFAKISFFKLHFFYLAPQNNKYHDLYCKFYILIIHKFCVNYYKYFFFIAKIMLLILILFFFKDLYLNNYVLDQTLYFIKYYSLFKIIYVILSFVALRQDLDLDYYLFSLYYCEHVSLDEGYFAETLGKMYGQVEEYEDNILKS